MSERAFQLQCEIDQPGRCKANKRAIVNAGESVEIGLEDFVAKITVHGESEDKVAVSVNLESGLRYITPDLMAANGEQTVIEFCGRVLLFTVTREA